MSIQERVRRHDNIAAALRAKKRDAPDSNTSISTYFCVKKRIGGKSRFAETHLASVRDVPDTDVALKVLPVTADPTDDRIDWSIKEVIKEIRILDDLGDLVKQHVTPNLPLSFDTLICFNCRYSNPTLRTKNAPTSCVVIPNELADGDLEKWMRTGHTPEEWKSCIFQVLAGLCAIEDHLGIYHGDLHDGNMLFTDTPPGGFWHYRFAIEGETYDYYVPNTGQLWKLWDFGQSKIGLTPTRQNRKQMWKDLDKAIGTFILERPPREKRRIGTTLSSRDYAHVSNALKDANTRQYLSPAFDVLWQLDWFNKLPPNGEILNAGFPYVVQCAPLAQEHAANKKQKRA